MRSFSSFKPVHEGPPREVKAATFAMWLRANAFNVKKQFDRATWRTARPWLTFNEVRYQLKIFRNRSLGSLQLGHVILIDKDVETAVRYEAYATRQICQLDIKEMILNFYDFSQKHKISRREVLDNINKEFNFLDRGFISERDYNWKQAIKSFQDKKVLMLKPKLTEHQVAEIILEVFDITSEPISEDRIKAQITPTMNAMGQTISQPLLRRALAITGTKLTYKNHLEIIQNVINKYYIPHRLGAEPLERLQHIVNQQANIPYKNKIWDLIDLHIVAKHNWDLETYEQAFHEQYHDPPQVTPLQLPFMKYKLPYTFVRKKQKIPWKPIIDLCFRGHGTDTKTIENINKILIEKGFIPYSHCHPEIDQIKVQGLKLHNLSSDASQGEQLDDPHDEYDEKKHHCNRCEQCDSAVSPHSGGQTSSHSCDDTHADTL